MRNKGKVHPFSSASSASSPNTDAFPVLKLLPAAIITLLSILSLEDREVLAYMITRSLKSTNPSIFPSEDKKRSSKKQSSDAYGHKSPALFDCDCFHCYTSYWLKWDSSPNRELIHQAIEAFEEHLNNGEQLKKSSANGKNKRKEKVGRGRKTGKVSSAGSGGVVESPAVESSENQDYPVVVPPESEVAVVDIDEVEPTIEVQGLTEDEAATPAVVVRTHKGLARKVLPDVIGIFSSRLWSLWSPNV